MDNVTKMRNFLENSHQMVVAAANDGICNFPTYHHPDTNASILMASCFVTFCCLQNGNNIPYFLCHLEHGGALPKREQSYRDSVKMA